MGSQKLVLIKRPVERQRHVIMKAFLWALYLPQYPQLQVEVSIGQKYKPDLVAFESGIPKFWGEAGKISAQKLRHILARQRNTHFGFAIWASSLAAFETRVRRQIKGVRRKAPVDLIRFLPQDDERFISQRGQIDISHADVEWCRIS